MKLTIDEMMEKVEAFAKVHVIPNLATDKSRFLLGFAWASVKAKLRKTLEDMPKDGLIREEDGRIDTDKLQGCVKNGFELAGSVLLDERLPLRFSQSDADVFFEGLGNNQY